MNKLFVFLSALSVCSSAPSWSDSPNFGPKLRPIPSSGETGLLRENNEAKVIERVSKALSAFDIKVTTPPLEKVTLSEGGAKCNDGSLAGFYTRLSAKSKTWIIFLEGGWYCFNYHSCKTRWKNSKHLMSSKSWPEEQTIGGIMSANPLENPKWWRANHVYIPYCSSDCWSGTRRGSQNISTEIVDSLFSNSDRFQSTNSSEIESLPFMGASIIEEVINNLVLNHGLKNRHSVILSGSSAGAVGVFLNVDNVQQQLVNLGLNVDVRGIADSGWFLDNEPFIPSKCQNAHTCAPKKAVQIGLNLWKGRIPNKCRKMYAGRPWECYLGYKVLPTIIRPIFIFQWIFDEAQMMLNNVGKPVSKQHWNYIHNIGESVKRSLSNASYVFAPSCISHASLTSKYWSGIKIGQTSLSDSLNCWSKKSFKRRKNGPRKINSTHNSDSKSSKRSRNSKGRKRCRNCKRKMNKDNNNTRNRKTSSEISLQNHQKSNPKTSSQILTKTHMLSDSPGQSFQYEAVTKRGKNKRRRNRKRKRKRHNKLKRRKRNKRIRENRRKRKTLKDGSVDLRSEVTAEFHPKKESCQQLHLVDDCSWPHCNPTCPPLINPYTGEEMNRVQLLKSFGLNMGDLAQALGVDLATLKAMDNDDIILILTP